ncbi:type 1 glutamine amidotransferase domain-containing protein [Marivirga atlantica]|jgi:protease I|uniref:Type 1 glutamine amidotransferase n=1 Tax=Marivirga atlantica TaxID=1548457 RepID=A0A937DH93_9BACT|nr:type 1 glutamine amidotransferase domain-containing protein [Marivirga atlantica]MBL0765663.1 type 1 glutamine amidotransferase [Marivirga atlantica]
MSQLQNKNIAILTETGFEEVELTVPRKKLEEEGAIITIISPENKSIKSWDQDHWGFDLEVDKLVEEVKQEDFDGLLLPGGVINPDKLRRSEKAIDFIKTFFEKGKPVASICHGPQSLIEADVLQGRIMTSFPSIKTDLKNAGARWVDKEVVVDQGLVTSRNPDDLEAFCSKMVEEFREGIHQGQKTA